MTSYTLTMINSTLFHFYLQLRSSLDQLLAGMVIKYHSLKSESAISNLYFNTLVIPLKKEFYLIMPANNSNFILTWGCLIEWFSSLVIWMPSLLMVVSMLTFGAISPKQIWIYA